ncbi:MAG TPA: ABC transporter permease [Flavobacteriales bacterium]|nr:ABC transporter permease [Flavobacteriales bacterium]
MKNLRLAFRIALVHLSSRKKQTLVAMLGVTFGISMFIIMISFMTGVNDFLMDLTLDGSPHIHLYNPVKIDRPPLASATYDTTKNWILIHHQRPKQELPRIKNGIQILEQIRKTPGVFQASPQLNTQVFFNNGPLQFAGTVMGIDVMAENSMYKLYEKMELGTVDRLLTNREGILMGDRLAKKMNVSLGDRVSLTTPQGGTFLLKVVGIFSFGISAIDDTRCYVNLQTAQKLLGKPIDYFTDINLKMVDYRRAAELAPLLEQRFGYKAEDWQTANAGILAGEVVRNSMTYVVAVTMLIVAGFGIYNIMNMTVVNKMRDIAIMKATGFEGKNIISIFLLQSVIIGILGALMGVALGALISYGIDQIPFPARDIIKLDTFPVSYKFKHYFLGIFFGFITTLFAGYFPSKKASKVDPVAIIRG